MEACGNSRGGLASFSKALVKIVGNRFWVFHILAAPAASTGLFLVQLGLVCGLCTEFPSKVLGRQIVYRARSTRVDVHVRLPSCGDVLT